VDRLHLAIDSNLNEVVLVAVSIRAVCLSLGMDELQASQMELSTVEAMTNAIRHAYHGKSGHRVSILISASMDRISIEVSDSGTPMSLQQEERLLHGSEISNVEVTDLSLLAEAGRGLQIIHDLAEEVTYRRERNQNILQFTKLLVPAKAG
jgi:serine/threonine-protein kinase RsbW